MNSVPPDLRKALAAAPAAKARWDDLTPIAQRDFVSWIISAKQAKTREQRIDRTCDMLVAGKRRPCCFAVVPFDLHAALKAAPVAKARWGDLTGDERRDFIDWIQSAAQRDVRKRRIAETCATLSKARRSTRV